MHATNGLFLYRSEMEVLIRRSVLTMSLSSSTALASAQSNLAEQQLTPLLSERMSAANSHDADRFMAAYQNSAALSVTFDDATIVGWKPLRDQQRQWWNDGKSTAVFEEVGPTRFLAISDDVIATVQAIRVKASPAKEAATVAKLTATSIGKKLPQGWRIVLAHESMTH